ncbi:hypothetical protein EWB00_000036 [Schistosoma japonicum]|uniref:Uncharacterized protein n=1 Tax=Schistosoma japonicum TaxID=6182 RepID=A0A4Z2CL51_SCHJA|nr:hypothetical protein EWB00_000036 [Schistosoma japonicum]
MPDDQKVNFVTRKKANLQLVFQTAANGSVKVEQQLLQMSTQHGGCTTLYTWLVVQFRMDNEINWY